MTLFDLATAQASDPFRIVLMGGLVWTTLRQRAATGLVLPLALGVVFFAVLLPVVMGRADGVSLIAAVASGVVVHAAWVAVLFGAWTIWSRRQGG
jgi:hypothetical protein